MGPACYGMLNFFLRRGLFTSHRLSKAYIRLQLYIGFIEKRFGLCLFIKAVNVISIGIKQCRTRDIPMHTLSL